jgi:hypothetical protein
MAEIDAILARVSELERAMVEITQAQKSARWVLPIAISIFVAGAGLVGALNVYAIARIDTVGDRVSDTRDTATTIGADVTVLKGRFDGLERQVANVDSRLGAVNEKVDYLTATTNLVARAVGISANELPQPRDPNKPIQ